MKIEDTMITNKTGLILINNNKKIDQGILVQDATFDHMLDTVTVIIDVFEKCQSNIEQYFKTVIKKQNFDSKKDSLKIIQGQKLSDAMNKDLPCITINVKGQFVNLSKFVLADDIETFEGYTEVLKSSFNGEEGIYASTITTGGKTNPRRISFADIKEIVYNTVKAQEECDRKADCWIMTDDFGSFIAFANVVF